jgi:hypothetical protein
MVRRWSGEGDRECPVQVAADGNSFMASLLGLGGISDKMQDNSFFTQFFQSTHQKISG